MGRRARSRARGRPRSAPGWRSCELARRGDPDDAAADDADVAAGGGRRRSSARTVERGSPLALVQSCPWESSAGGRSESRGASIALAVARRARSPSSAGSSSTRGRSCFEPDSLADRCADRARRTSATRLAIAQPIVDGIVDRAPASWSTPGRSSSRSSSRRSARRPPRPRSPRPSRAIDAKLAEPEPRTRCFST